MSSYWDNRKTKHFVIMVSFSTIIILIQEGTKESVHDGNHNNEFKSLCGHILRTIQ